MKVFECIQSNIIPCQLHDNAKTTALTMWKHKLKNFPIVNNEQKVIGIISDSDICKYSVMNHKAIWEITVNEIYKQSIVYHCYQDDNAKTALNSLIKNHLQWLPVINQQQQFIGIIRLSDIISKTLKRSNIIKLPHVEPVKNKTPIIKSQTGFYDSIP